MNSFIFEKMNRKYNTYDVVKDIAFITMIIDHIGYYLMPKLLFLRLIGRISAVLYAILFGINKNHKNINKLFTFAIITAIVQLIMLDSVFPTNIFFNFFISLFLVDYLELAYNKYPYIFCCIFIPLLFPVGIITDQITEYGLFLTALIFSGRIFSKEEKDKKDLIITLIVFLIYFIYSSRNFKFSIFQSIILFIFLACIYINMFDFKSKEIDNVKCETFLLVISRYSMELFVIQTIIFSLILRMFIWQY